MTNVRRAAEEKSPSTVSAMLPTKTDGKSLDKSDITTRSDPPQEEAKCYRVRKAWSAQGPPKILANSNAHSTRLMARDYREKLSL